MNDNDIKEKFEEIYHSKIEKIVGDFETLRLEKKKKYDFFRRLTWFFALCFVGIVILDVTGLLKSYYFILPSFITIILSIVFVRCSSNIADKFRKSVKSPLLNPILSVFGKLEITNTEQVSLKEIRQMGLYYQAKKKKDDDIISGTYKDLNISITETRLSHFERSNQINSSEIKNVTDFRGLVIKIKLNKDFESVTIVKQIENIENYINMITTTAQKHPELCPQGLLKYLDIPLKTINKINNSDKKFVIKNGKICVDIFDKNSRNKITKKLEKVTLEDPEFNKNYEVYSNDQVESRYWLSPSFMEKIKNIQSVFLATTTNLAFKEGYLYLFLDGCSGKGHLIEVTDGYGFFEAGDINKTLLDKNVYLKLFRELISIFTLLNYLKQN